MVQEPGYKFESFSLSNSQVGYIFRLEHAPRAGETKDWGHSSCILPYGHPVSFGYTTAAYVEATYLANSLIDKITIHNEKGILGEIQFYDRLSKVYTDVKLAIRHGYESSVLIINLDDMSQAIKFNNFWSKNPKRYNKFLNNCSSMCYDAFREAGIIQRSFTPIMTPRKLYDHILDTCQSRRLSYLQMAGFIGFVPRYSNRYEMLIAQKLYKA